MAQPAFGESSEHMEKQFATRYFLATHRPLIQTLCGRQAAARKCLLPFIDGSCRREPDFESHFPSISATCRASLFAPRLRVGDRVVYLTTKGKYLADIERGWRFVAILQIIHRFSSHLEAATWYEQQNLAPPSNCFVEGNPPKPFELTNGNPPKEIRERVRLELNSGHAVRLWDATYRSRIAKCPVFLVTKPNYLQLNNPPQLRDTDMLEIFGKIPATLNPPEITGEQFNLLKQFAVG